ncbi:hypothetical protein A2229_02830 [Candidatus Peregrinibacteria bacterium RIFOXYA2_FULL_33_7]|nr:MAG: hypothetical protein A2229_02830 [Candidatus Peregrinibacteria bacterium RIFOXYA2_FULL_33_7]
MKKNMDKLTKFLKKRTKAEQKLLILTMKLIIAKNLTNLDVKKLKGEKTLFRVRIGSFRIIFNCLKDENKIMKINKRDDQTYKNL